MLLQVFGLAAAHIVIPATEMGLYTTSSGFMNSVLPHSLKSVICKMKLLGARGMIIQILNHAEGLIATVLNHSATGSLHLKGKSSKEKEKKKKISILLFY